MKDLESELPDRYAFGGFTLERAQRRVLKSDGTPLNLSPRLFGALLLLVEHAGELLDKDTLMQALWPRLVVEENNLSQVISGLRRALGDDAQGRHFIQTVPRRGFRFVAAVTPLPAVPTQAPQPLPEQALSQAPSPAPRRRRLLWLAGPVALGAAAGWAWLKRPPAQAVLPAAHGATLAVLPFKPLVAEGRDELLEVGMADSLIARLSTMPGLVVRSTGSVLRYAGAEQDPLRAARELDVQWIVDGSLQRRGDQFRATARLLRAADGVAAWSGGFDEKFTGVFELQDQISRRVMGALVPTLSGQAAPPSGPAAPTLNRELGGTRNTEAYQLYLTASWRSVAMRLDDIKRGIALFHQALELDPSYAQAWAGLAWAHRRKLWIDVAPSEVFEPANTALLRAVAIEPQLPQALAGLAFSRYWYERDWPGAERAFREALALNRNVPNAHWGLAQLLLTQGRIDEGFAHMRSYRELDPMSPIASTLEASFLLDNGQLAAARARLNRALDIAPRLWLAHVCLGLLHLAEQQTGPGIAALRRAVELGETSSRPRAVLGARLAALGETTEARAILAQLLAQAQQRYVPPTSLAAVHAALGETEPALGALERAVALRDTRVIYLKDDPHHARLRGEPRFIALLKQLRLDGYGRGLSPV